mmetsp:Transcript_9787/g.17804  ORF Transcript_9787/g.17804 Transcript_9787/m.17804 type:complete len:229 (+) Transcript_9787:410-1096(+)
MLSSGKPRARQTSDPSGRRALCACSERAVSNLERTFKVFCLDFALSDIFLAAAFLITASAFRSSFVIFSVDSSFPRETLELISLKAVSSISSANIVNSLGMGSGVDPGGENIEHFDDVNIKSSSNRTRQRNRSTTMARNSSSSCPSTRNAAEWIKTFINSRQKQVAKKIDAVAVHCFAGGRCSNSMPTLASVGRSIGQPNKPSTSPTPKPPYLLSWHVTRSCSKGQSC